MAMLYIPSGLNGYLVKLISLKAVKRMLPRAGLGS